MLDAIVEVIDRASAVVFWTCVVGFIVVNVSAVAMVIRTRRRDLVNQWTGRVLAANALLLGAGLGVPAAAFLAKSAVQAFAPSLEQRAARLLQAEAPAAVQLK